ARRIGNTHHRCTPRPHTVQFKRDIIPPWTNNSDIAVSRCGQGKHSGSYRVAAAHCWNLLAVQVRRKAGRVAQVQGTAVDVRVHVVPAGEPDRVLRRETADSGIVVPRSVVIQTCSIALPTPELQRVGACGTRYRACAKGLERVMRLESTRRVGQFQGGPERISQGSCHAGRIYSSGELIETDSCKQICGGRALGRLLVDKIGTIVPELRRRSVHVLAAASSECVIREGR